MSSATTPIVAELPHLLGVPQLPLDTTSPEDMKSISEKILKLLDGLPHAQAARVLEHAKNHLRMHVLKHGIVNANLSEEADEETIIST